MYTLDINTLKKQGWIHFGISLFLLVFTIIYERYSNGIYSVLMRISFLVPLLLGSGLSLLVIKTKKFKITNRTQAFLNSLIATTVLYFLMMGVLKIFGTTNPLTYGYLVLITIILIATVISVVLDLRKKEV